MTPRPKSGHAQRSTSEPARKDGTPRSIVPLEAQIWSGTDVGRKRPSNEDCYGVWVPSDAATRQRIGALVVVADGMGGSQSGEIASQMAVDAVIRVVSEASEDDMPATLQQAIEEANREVHAASLADPQLNGMGTTCTAIAILDDVAWVGHVGDSRAYLIRGNQIRQLTSDHTLVARLVESREITRQQAKRDPRRNIVTRSVGPMEEVEPDVFRADVALRPGDTILVCSDGLHGCFNESELADIVRDAPYPSEVVRELIAEANDRGGPDNITVVLVRLEAALEPARSDQLPEAREA